jgi:hypothetical protein
MTSKMVVMTKKTATGREVMTVYFGRAQKKDSDEVGQRGQVKPEEGE